MKFSIILSFLLSSAFLHAATPIEATVTLPQSGYSLSIKAWGDLAGNMSTSGAIEGQLTDRQDNLIEDNLRFDTPPGFPKTILVAEGRKNIVVLSSADNLQSLGGPDGFALTLQKIFDRPVTVSSPTGTGTGPAFAVVVINGAKLNIVASACEAALVKTRR